MPSCDVSPPARAVPSLRFLACTARTWWQHGLSGQVQEPRGVRPGWTSSAVMMDAWARLTF